MIILMVITMTFFLVACDSGDPVPEETDKQIIKATSEPIPEPSQKPIPADTPEPIPEVTPEPDSVGFKFPFNFSSVDLYGNVVTDEDLGEKELFFAYLWAVW